MQHSLIQLCVVAAAAATLAAATTTLQSVGGLPAHVAGRFTELTLCRQAADGAFLVFDRRSHTVFSVAPGVDEPREIVQIGAERAAFSVPTRSTARLTAPSSSPMRPGAAVGSSSSRAAAHGWVDSRCPDANVRW